jgi:hypothetical protein
LKNYEASILGMNAHEFIRIYQRDVYAQEDELLDVKTINEQ